MKKRLTKAGNSGKRFRRLPLTIVVAAVILAVGAVTVISRQMGGAKEEANNQASKPSARSAANNRYVTVKVAGRYVQVDGQTGEIKELTPEEKERLAASLKQLINRSDEGLVEERHADGTVTVDLEGRFQNVTVAKVNDDGSLSEGCVDNAEAAGAFFGIDPQMIENQPGAASSSTKQTRVAPVRNPNR